MNTRKREKNIDIRWGSERYFDYREPNTEQTEQKKPIREGEWYQSKKSFLPLEEKEKFGPFFQKRTYKKGDDMKWHASKKKTLEKKGSAGSKGTIDERGDKEHVCRFYFIWKIRVELTWLGIKLSKGLCETSSGRASFIEKSLGLCEDMCWCS